MGIQAQCFFDDGLGAKRNGISHVAGDQPIVFIEQTRENINLRRTGAGTCANNRIVSDSHLAMLGDGGYDPGARARQIRNGLLATDKIDYEAVRRIHLDDRAILMERWRDLALTALRTTEVEIP